MNKIEFTVIDKLTGQKADICEIAHEAWAKDLTRYDMEGFAICEDGTLILMDECGKFEYCPTNRFEVTMSKEFK